MAANARPHDWLEPMAMPARAAANQNIPTELVNPAIETIANQQ